MTTFTWSPSSLGQNVDWNTASDWLPVGVPNAPDADVVVPLITQSGTPYPFDIQITAAASYTVHSLSLTDSDLVLQGTLSIGAGLTLGAGSVVVISGSLSLGSLADPAGTGIQGSGQVSSASSIENQGKISGSGLTLTLAGLQNDGTLVATDLLAVDLTGGTGDFTNLADGTLTGGTYEALAGGTLLLNVGAAVTTDAATIVFDNSASPSVAGTIETAGGNIEQTLATIASGDVLTLNDAAFQTANTLWDAGIVTLAQGTLATGALTIAAGATLAGSGAIAGPITNDGLLSASPEPVGPSPSFAYSSDLVVSGGVAGAGSIAIAAAAQYFLFGTHIVGETLELGGAVAETVSFGDNNGVLVIDSPTLFTGTIDGFVAGIDHEGLGGIVPVSDAVILPGVSIGAITGKQYNPDADGGTLILQEATGSIALQFAGNYKLGDFVVAAGPRPLSSSPPSVEITELLPCFAAGTRISTATGEVPVEALCIGDEVSTLLGAPGAAVRWLGHRRVDCRLHSRPHDVWPVRVQAGAFADEMPRRDLWLSPDHAVYCDGSLIPIRYLVNGTTIAQEAVERVTYWHVELPRHGVILAEGLPCESYLDTGNRGAFANGGPAVQMHPDFALSVWEAKACAPLVRDGARLQAARSRLLERAGLLGFASTPDPALRLIAGGRVVRPEIDGDTHRFRLPATACGVRLVSRGAIPAEVRADGRDHRRLGVAVSRIALDGQPIALTDPRLSSGWHEVEHGGAEPGDGEGAAPAWRWTDGHAGLALAGVRLLEVEVAMTARYWVEREASEAAIPVARG